MAVRTSLDARTVVRALRELAATRPEAFRTTCKWVPVDLWTRGDLEALRQGVSRVQVRIGATERWRMTIEKRAKGTLPTPALIAVLAELVPAPVHLTNPEKILMIQLFPDRAALSVLSPSEVFSMVPVPWLGLVRGRAAPVPGARAARTEPLPGMPTTLGELAASLPALAPALIESVTRITQDSARPFREMVDLALELVGRLVPEWPVASEWNRWCVRNGASFTVWPPSRGALPDRARADALIHTIMMISAKEHAIRDYLASGVREAEVVMAGDDCVVCDMHRHRQVPLVEGAAAAMPPFHPGCRCGFRPHLG